MVCKLKYILLAGICILSIVSMISCDGENDSKGSVFGLNPTLPGLNRVVAHKVYVNTLTGFLTLPANSSVLNTYSRDDLPDCPSGSGDALEANTILFIVILQFLDDVSDTSRCDIFNFDDKCIFEGLRIYIESVDGEVYELAQELDSKELQMAKPAAYEILDVMDVAGNQYCAVASIKIPEPSEVQKIGFKIVDEEGNYSAFEWICFADIQ